VLVVELAQPQRRYGLERQRACERFPLRSASSLQQWAGRLLLVAAPRHTAAKGHAVVSLQDVWQLLLLLPRQHTSWGRQAAAG
jgi:hypothetical protein